MRKISLIVLVTFISFGCSSPKEEKKEEGKIGKYVYLDSQDILHIRKHCSGLEITNLNTGVSFYRPIEFIDTTVITNKEITSMCSWCVDDEHYQQLKQISERNKERDIFRKCLYERLEQDYNMEPYDTFVKNIADSIKRKEMYDVVCEEKWYVGSYKSFSMALGIKE